MADVYLILHGWGGNKPEHWQEHLAHALRAAGEGRAVPQDAEPDGP